MYSCNQPQNPNSHCWLVTRSCPCRSLLPCVQYAQKGYAIGCIYMYLYIYIYIYIFFFLYMYKCHKNHLFGIFPIRKSLEKCSWRFSFALKCHECDSRLPGRVLILFLCLHLCVPSVLQGPWGAHTFSLIGRCVVTPATMLT